MCNTIRAHDKCILQLVQCTYVCITVTIIHFVISNMFVCERVRKYMNECIYLFYFFLFSFSRPFFIPLGVPNGLMYNNEKYKMKKTKQQTKLLVLLKTKQQQKYSSLSLLWLIVRVYISRFLYIHLYKYTLIHLHMYMYLCLFLYILV